MENVWWEEMDAAALKATYEIEQQALANALLNGASWESLKDKRNAVTWLSILLYRRSSGHPAENGTRRPDNDSLHP